MSKVLVLNAGSSSLKYKLFSKTGPRLVPLVSGLAERIGESAGKLTSKFAPEAKGPAAPVVVEDAFKDHTVALKHVLNTLNNHFTSSFKDDMVAVGHRVVHGGTVSKASVIDNTIITAIQDAAELAPLHNPANLLGIQAAMNIFHCPQVAVFDTAFHQTMPPEAYLYAIPRKFYEEKKIRRFGMHGTSHMFLTERAAQMLGKPTSQTNLIVCHLGAGSSMCAVKGGKSVDTTMGVTPLEGLVMATRSGDVDPAIPLMLMDMYKLSAHDVDNVLNKQSGLFGLCGHKDLRTIMQGMDKGDEPCKQAFDSFVYRIRKYLGAYMVTLNGKVDAVVFSAGIGENASRVRAAVCEGLEDMGISIDSSKNDAAVGKQADISGPGAAIRTLVVPTDEELSIAEQSLEAISKAQNKSARAA